MPSNVDRETRPVPIDVMLSFIETSFAMQIPLILTGELLLHILSCQTHPPTLRIPKYITTVECEWLDVATTPRKVEDAVKHIVANLGFGGLHVVKLNSRPDSKKLIFFVHHNNKEIFQISVKLVDYGWYETYNTRIGRLVLGVSLDKLYADKLSSISRGTVSKSVGDLYDMYLLAHFYSVNTLSISNLLAKPMFELGYFLHFSNTRTGEESKEKLRVRYSSIGGIKNKPTFNEVFDLVYNYTKPFHERWHGTVDATWVLNPQTGDAGWRKN